MNHDSKTREKELHLTIARFQQDKITRKNLRLFLIFLARFLRSRSWLCRWRRSLCNRRSHLPSRSVRLRDDFRGFLVFALCLFWFRLFLDSRELPQNLFPFFWSLASARQLHRKDLLYDCVELLPCWHSNRRQFIGDRSNSLPHRPPFVQVRMNRSSHLLSGEFFCRSCRLFIKLQDCFNFR